MPTRKRGKTLNTTRIVEILNADGGAAEIAEATGYSISTVRKVRKLEGKIGDLFRLDYIAPRLMAAGLITHGDDLTHAMPEDGEIGAVLGLHHWRKCRSVIQKRRAENAAVADLTRRHDEADQQIGGLEIISGCVDRFIDRGGRLN